jgi:hypothetical protein
MELFQLIVQSIFSLIGAASILFVAARAYSIGSDVSEIKDLLKEIKRETLRQQDFGFSGVKPVVPGNTELGKWPSVADPGYDSGPSANPLPYGLREPEETGQTATRGQRPAGW